MPDACEEVANWMIKQSMATGHGDTLQDLLGQIVAHERERCRKIAKSAWLTCEFGEIADADYGNALCEHIETLISQQ